jgi:hypothetical protein
MQQSNKVKVVTGKVRFSYANVFQPKAGMNGGEQSIPFLFLFQRQILKLLTKLKKHLRIAKQAMLLILVVQYQNC